MGQHPADGRTTAFLRGVSRRESRENANGSVRRARVRRFALAPLILAVAWVPGHLQGQAVRELTNVRDIRSLTPDQASKGLPVRLRGVVTVLPGYKSNFFFQDATAGISVERTRESPEVHQGQLVEIRGVTGPGMFAPVVDAETVTSLGEGKLWPAHVFGEAQLAGGKQDSQYLAMRGIVRSAQVETIWERAVLILEIDIGSGNLATIRIHDFSKGDWTRLPGATVVVQGVCGTVFNDRRQFVGLRLFVANLTDVKVERPAPTDPFDLPSRHLGSTLRFGDDGGGISRVKVQGIVTYSQPGHSLYLQDGHEGMLVETTQKTPVALGSRLEVVGYPAAGSYSPKLNSAIFRVVGTGSPVAGLAHTAAEMIIYNDGSRAAPYDSVLVQLNGRLVEQIPGDHQDVLVLTDGTSMFSARLSQTSENRVALAIGSLLRVTGICVATADETHEARSYEILIRSPEDLVVLERSSWWTAGHAEWVVVVLVFVVLAMAGWMAFSRWKASLQALTLTDALTGLSNRRGFLMFAEHQWQLAQRKKSPFLLFYIDLDCFKEINDTLGHKTGDQALQAVAGILRYCFRKTDIIGRLGGDEFAVTASDAPPHTRLVLEQRLAKAIEECNEKVDQKFRIALSIGILACDDIGPLSIEELLAQADVLMYQQKRERKSSRTQTTAPIVDQPA